MARMGHIAICSFGPLGGGMGWEMQGAGGSCVMGVVFGVFG